MKSGIPPSLTKSEGSCSDGHVVVGLWRSFFPVVTTAKPLLPGAPLSDLITNFNTQVKISDRAGTKVAKRSCGLRRDDLGGMGRRKQPGAKGWCHKFDALGCF